MPRLIALLSLLAIAACSSPTAPTRGVSLRVLGVSIGADPQYRRVSFDVANLSADTVYLPACGAQVGTAVEAQRSTGAWENASAAICPAVLPQDPIALAPGAVLAAERTVVAAAGHFRLATTAWRAGSVYAPWEMRSEAFEIR